MSGYEDRDGVNGNHSGSSPRQHSVSSHGDADNRNDSKYRDSHDYERESLRSRDREKEKSRDRDRKKDNEKDTEKEKERDKGRHRDRDRDRGRDREGDRDRDRGRDWENDRDRDRERDRYRSRRTDYERDRDDRHSSRSQSHSRARSHHRSRSRSGSPHSRSHLRSKSKRISGFDMAPPAAAILPGATPVAPAAATGRIKATGQIPGATAAIPGMFSNMYTLPGQLGTLPVMPVQTLTQQATRYIWRVYVGGVSPTANEQSVAVYFSHVMAAIGGNTAGPGDAVVNVYINREKKFAFVEMRSVEEASNAMALDGIIFEGTPVKVRRPTDYKLSLAATLGPCQPSPNLNLAAVGLSPGSAADLEGPDRIFVGGLPYYLTELQVRELLEIYGSLRGFDLVKDRETGNSKGYAFCVYNDVSVTDFVCQTLTGIQMGGKTLTVRRANQGVSQPKPEQESVLLHAKQQIALQKMILQPGGVPTKVVCLTRCVTVDDLKDDWEYQSIVEDMMDEGGKFGSLVNVVIPRPNPNGEPAPGVGKVFMEYGDIESASKARKGMNRRLFDGNQVTAVYYPENKFAEGEYDG